MFTYTIKDPAVSILIFTTMNRFNSK